MPGAGDDVTIAAPNISISHFGGDVSVHSLHSTANLMFLGSLTLAAASQSSGMLSISNGNLNLQANAALTSSGNGMVMGNVQLAANSELVVNGGMFNVSSGMGQSNVTLAAGSELLVSAGMFGIGNGNLTNQGGRVELDAGSFMFMGGIFTNPGGTVAVNGGTFTLIGGTFTDGGGTVNVAGGVFSISAMASFTQNNPADNLVIGAAGEMDISGTANLNAGSVQVAGLLQQTGGTINAATTIQLAAANANLNLIGGQFNVGQAFLAQGPGQVTVGPGNPVFIVNANTNVANLTLQTGGTIQGAATLTITNTMTWTGGTVNGQNGLSTLIGPNATLTISGTGNKTLNQGNFTIDTQATATMSGGSWTVSAANIFNNGYLKLQGGGLSMVSQGNSQLVNRGTFFRTQAPMNDITQVGLPFFNLNGTVLVDSGTLSFGSAFTQQGPNSSFVILSLATVRELGTMEIDGGLIRISGILQIGNLLDVGQLRVDGSNGPTFTGQGQLQIDLHGQLQVVNGWDVSQVQVTNNGTFTWSSGTISLTDSAAIGNGPGGDFLIQSDDTLIGSPGCVFNNAGQIRKDQGTGQTSFAIALNDQRDGNAPQPTVAVNTGSLALQGSGNHNASFDIATGAKLFFNGSDQNNVLLAQTSFNGAGGLVVTHDSKLTMDQGAQVTVNTQMQLGTTEGADVLKGIIAGPGQLRAGGLFTWTRGDLMSGLIFANWGTLNIVGEPDSLIDSSILDNMGTVNWTGFGNIIFGHQAGLPTPLIQNDATFNFQTFGEMRVTNTADPIGDFVNASTGIVNYNGWVPPPGPPIPPTNPNHRIAFTNNGVFVIKTQATFVGGFTQNQGVFRVIGVRATVTPAMTINGGWFDFADDRNGILAVPAGLTIGANGGLAGVGTIQGDVTNQGTINLGYFSRRSDLGAISLLNQNGQTVRVFQGTLNVDGDYTQTNTAHLVLRLPGWTGNSLNLQELTGFDRLDVTGEGTLSGQLAVQSQAGAFDPAPGTSFWLVEFGTDDWTTDFTNYTLPNVNWTHDWEMDQWGVSTLWFFA